jgi:glycosyltransferase involved in cell wall biosynthesis
MKILQVIHAFVPAWDYGGSLRVCYEVSKELAKRGHDVTVYTTDALNSKERVREKEEVIEGIKVNRFRNLSNDIAFTHHLFISPGMILSLKNNLKYFDIVHLHEYRTIHNVAVRRYARKFGIPYIVQAHGAIPRVSVKQRLKQLYDNTWGYKILRDASGVIALTETEAEKYRSMGVEEGKIIIVPNGVNPLEFENLPPGQGFKKQYGIEENEKIILYLGRIHETKGIELLVNAFASLSGEIDGVKLVIVGPDDGYRDELTGLARSLGISHKIIYTGPVYGADRLGAYASASVFVTPSFLGFPVTFVEACACGTPVITTDNGDRIDWIDNQVGYVVPYDNNALKDAMIKVLKDNDLARQFGEKGMQLVRENLNWSSITDKLENVYREAMTVNKN